MALKRFLQDLFERLGLAEATAPPPEAADVPLAELAQLAAIFPRLAAWGVKRLHLVVGDESQPDDLLQAVSRAARLGMQVGVRGRASDLPNGSVLTDLASAGLGEIEIPFLSAIGEVHDALAGAGDYRAALRVMDTMARLALPLVAQAVLAPSTWKTLERSWELLGGRGVREVRCFPIVCRDEEPSSWAVSAGELLAAARRIEQCKRDFDVAWYPPRRFDPARTLAQQVRDGPRAAADAVRVEPDGRVIPPAGPAVSGGNVLQTDWKAIARSEAFRAWKRRRGEALRGLSGIGRMRRDACANSSIGRVNRRRLLSTQYSV